MNNSGPMQYWALRHWADDVDDGRRAAAEHDTECSASDILVLEII